MWICRINKQKTALFESDLKVSFASYTPMLMTTDHFCLQIFNKISIMSIFIMCFLWQEQVIFIQLGLQTIFPPPYTQTLRPCLHLVLRCVLVDRITNEQRRHMLIYTWHFKQSLLSTFDHFWPDYPHGADYVKRRVNRWIALRDPSVGVKTWAGGLKLSRTNITSACSYYCCFFFMLSENNTSDSACQSWNPIW